MKRLLLLNFLLSFVKDSNGKKGVIVTILLMVISAAAFALGPMFLGYWVTSLENHQMSLFYRFFTIYLILYFIGYLTRDLQWFSYAYVERSIHSHLGRALIEGSVRQNDAKKVSLSRITTILNGTQSFLFCSAFILIPLSIEAIGMFVSVFWSYPTGLSIAFFMFAIGFLTILFWGTKNVSQKNKVFVKEWNGSLDYMGQFIDKSDLFNRTRTIPFVGRQFSRQIQPRENSRINVARERTLTTIPLTFWIALFLSGLLVLGVYQYQKGLMTLGALVAVESYFFQIMRRLEIWARGYRETAISMDQVEGMISIAKFVHSENKVAEVSNSEVIAIGQWTAITGPTGSGKSTFLRSLARQLENAILVPQIPEVFPSTILENLTLGKIVSDDDVQQILRNLSLDHVVQRLPEGIHTQLEGNLLSVGELQRLSLARALLMKPDFLLLDETTSAQSEAEEQHVLKFIKSKYPNLTVLAVSHRPYALTLCEHLWRAKPDYSISTPKGDLRWSG